MPSLKPLKSVAHSLAHHFASTLCYWESDYAINHLAEASKRCHSPLVEIDLLAQTANPVEIQTDMVAEIIPYLKKYLLKLLDKEGFAIDAIASARLNYNFGVGRANTFNLLTYDCVSSITTTDGRTYEAYLTEVSN
jgi:hypothetical protein